MGHHGTWGAEIYGLSYSNLWSKKLRFRIYTERFWFKHEEQLMQETMVCFFLFGVGGHPEVKKSSQTTKNSKSSRCDLVFGGIFLSDPLIQRL